MRRAVTVLLLFLGLAGLASSGGALRCACCSPAESPAVDAADLCCPGGDATRCGFRASESPPAPSWGTTAEAPRALPPLDIAVSLRSVELHALAARPSSRDGLAMRSILRI